MLKQEFFLALLLAILAVSLLANVFFFLKKKQSRLEQRLESIEHALRRSENFFQQFELPQFRGAVGEILLDRLLRDWLPPKYYQLQYGFSDGSRVDAAVFLGDFIVPIDSKFAISYENGSKLSSKECQNLRKYIESIAEKYIRPKEKTLNFALMYLPSEALYYKLFIQSSDELFFALRKKVVPVSSSTLYAYIQTIAYGLKGWEFQQNRDLLFDLIDEMKNSLSSIKKIQAIRQSHLKNLLNSLDSEDIEYKKIQNLLKKIP